MRLRASDSSFLMASGSIYFAYRKSLLADIFGALGSEVEGPSAFGSMKIDLKNKHLRNLSPEKIDALLVHGHELEHARSFFGSPLGLLLFRCYFVINVTLGWLFQTFFIPGKLGAEGLRRATFIEWLEKDSLTWIQARLDSGDLSLPPFAGGEGLTPAELRQGSLSYLASVAIPEVGRVARFVRALLHRDDTMTMGEFASLANAAFAHLAMRCEIEGLPKWTTDSPDQLLYPKQDSILSTEELFEYVALQNERMAMEGMGLPNAAVIRWKGAFESPPYLAGFSLEERGKASPNTLLPLAHAALRTPIDLVVGTQEMLVESVHPTWRFRYNYFTVCDARPCPRTGLSVQERWARLSGVDNFPAWEKRLCELAIAPQMPVSNLRLDLGQTDIFGPGMVNDRQDRAMPDPRFSPSRDYEVVREAFRKALGSTLSGDLTWDRQVVLPLHYYDDVCSFNTLSSGADIFKMVGAHRMTVVNYLLLSLLYGGAEKPEMPPFGEAFFARLDGIAPGQTGNIRQNFMEQPIAISVFGKPFADALRWW